MIDAQWLLANEGSIRLAAFASVLLVLAVAERLLPRLAGLPGWRVGKG